MQTTEKTFFYSYEECPDQHYFHYEYGSYDAVYRHIEDRVNEDDYSTHWDVTILKLWFDEDNDELVVEEKYPTRVWNTVGRK